MDWKVHLDAVGGTGFVAASTYGPPIPTRLASDKGRFEHPNYIVIDGGRNDHGSETVEAQTVNAYFDAIARDYPAAQVIVIAPWLMRSEPTDYAATRCLVETQAMDHGWTYVDPLALGWVDSASAALVAPDGVHPDDAGYAYVARHLVHAMVRALSMPPPIAAACTLGA
jgi:GDSL-like lipase/acylhydrolase family protein